MAIPENNFKNPPKWDFRKSESGSNGLLSVLIMSDVPPSLRKRKAMPSSPTEEHRGGSRNSAGAKKGSQHHHIEVSKHRRRLSGLAHVAEVEEKRVATLQENITIDALLQAAMDHKHEHQVENRTKLVISEEEVYLRSERKKPKSIFCASCWSPRELSRAATATPLGSFHLFEVRRKQVGG